MMEEKKFRELVRSAGVEEPGRDFTQRVMKEVNAASAIPSAYVPIISRRAWIVFALCATGLIVLALAGSSGDSVSIENVLRKIQLPLSIDIGTLPETLFAHPLLNMLIISSALLLMADYFFFSRLRWVK